LTDETKIPNWPNTTDVDLSATIKTVVVDPLNAFLLTYFGGIPVLPQTIQERIEAVISKLIFFRNAANIPQIKIGV
jgi:hypothetical protein